MKEEEEDEEEKYTDKYTVRTIIHYMIKFCRFMERKQIISSIDTRKRHFLLF